MSEEMKSFSDFCPLCINYNSTLGVCSEIHENIPSNPKVFTKKCNGKFFEEDIQKKEKNETVTELSNNEVDENVQIPYSLDDILNNKKKSLFNGRISRSEYYMLNAIIGIALFIVIFISMWLIGDLDNIILLPIYITSFIIMLFLQSITVIKRLHDIERPGRQFWLLFIPIYNFYLQLLLLFKKGTNGLNKYGFDPLVRVNDLLNKGVELYEQKKFDEAEEKFKIALLRNKDSKEANYNLALVYLEQKKYDEAWEIVKKMEKSKIDCSEIISELEKHK